MLTFDSNSTPGGNFLFGEPGVGVLMGGVPISGPPQWTHLALTYDGAQVIFYMNGNLIGNPNQGTPPTIQTPNVLIGPSGGDEWYTQGISIWSSALDQTAIQQYMNGDDPTGQDSCLAFFPLLTDMGNTVTGNRLTGTTNATIIELTMPLATSPGATAAAATPGARARSAAASASGPGDIPILQVKDYKALAAQHGINVTSAAATTAAQDSVTAGALQWYEQFLTDVPLRTAAKLRAEFARNLSIGLQLRQKGILTGTHEVSVEGNDLVVKYHTPAGPQEVHRTRLTNAPSPFLQWCVTITIDVVGIVAAMLGIFSTAAKIAKAVSFEEALLEELGIAAKGAQNADKSKWALDSIWSMLKLLWEWKILFTLFKRIISGSWWSLTFTILSLIAQVATLVATSGWLIAWKVSQMAIAIGQLAYDLTQMPQSTSAVQTANG
ncbi:MAG: LamG-like jellyroll fold domain-containing protein [Acidobacteriota bacterium]